MTPMTLDQIPAMTDKDIDRWYAGVTGQRLIPTQNEAANEVAALHADHFWCREGTNDCQIELGGETIEVGGLLTGKKLKELLQLHPDSEIEQEIAEYRFKPRVVCHPDTPSSILEGLPAIVERVTGVGGIEIVMVRSTDPRDRWRVWLQPPFGRMDLREHATRLQDFAETGIRPRHLPHACFAAAVAACVVMGRKAGGVSK